MDMCAVDRDGLGLLRPKSLSAHEAVLGTEVNPTNAFE